MDRQDLKCDRKKTERELSKATHTLCGEKDYHCGPIKSTYTHIPTQAEMHKNTHTHTLQIRLDRSQGSEWMRETYREGEVEINTYTHTHTEFS